MKNAICTLFEGDYHFGVAALINSLVAAGFRGDFYAGFRGNIPTWDLTSLLACGINVHLIPLKTRVHLTNYKPDFMLQILAGDADVEAICYLDPDIVCAVSWHYISDWQSCGITLCEDVNSPLDTQHPRRVGWRLHLAKPGRPLRTGPTIYANAGFIGVSRADINFLRLWKELSEEVLNIVGGADVAKVAGGKPFVFKGYADCFDCSDQDALNAAVEASLATFSFWGRSAMAFAPGHVLLPHAIGASKPWQRSFIRFALSGVPPRRADEEFLKHCEYPIPVYPKWVATWRRLSLLGAKLICRFWRR